MPMPFQGKMQTFKSYPKPCLGRMSKLASPYAEVENLSCSLNMLETLHQSASHGSEGSHTKILVTFMLLRNFVIDLVSTCTANDFPEFV
jgi:hypothetical protein